MDAKPPLTWQDFRAAHPELSARQAAPLWQQALAAVQGPPRGVRRRREQPPTEAELFAQAVAALPSPPVQSKQVAAPARKGATRDSLEHSPAPPAKALVQCRACHRFQAHHAACVACGVVL
jgi:hypothetical protein